MTVGNLTEIYTLASTKVCIKLVACGKVFTGEAKDIPEGFYNWNITNVQLDGDSLIIVVKGGRTDINIYNEELTIFDLKSASWMDCSIMFKVKYKNDTNEYTEGTKAKTLRMLDKELCDSSKIVMFAVRDNYIVLSLDEDRKIIKQ